MNRKDYRAAFDAIPFREDFQRRTVQMLRQGAARPSQKECFSMKKKRVALIAACLSALLVVSAAAAALLLSPKDVAQRLGDLTLEEAEQAAAPADEGPSPLLSAVRALPEKYSAVIHLYYYEGYSIKEIAKLLSLPAPTVGTRLSRGRERLRQMLKEEIE